MADTFCLIILPHKSARCTTGLLLLLVFYYPSLFPTAGNVLSSILHIQKSSSKDFAELWGNLIYTLYWSYKKEQSFILYLRYG